VTRSARAGQAGGVPTARAPGRVTLIGDHTDYNEGLSLPMAIDLGTEATFTPTPDTFLVGLRSDQYAEPWEIVLGDTAPSPPPAVLAAALLSLARPPSGGSLTVTSTLPVGAGLSSSAAFSIALLLAVGALPPDGDDPADPLHLARLCQDAEAIAGSRVGLLDPLAILGAQAGHALSINFATFESHQVALPEGAAFVVVHSGTSRQLGASPYAARRAECEMAANHLGRALGRCELGDLSALPEPVLRRRARHVVTECRRVREVERLLARSDLRGVGALMSEGQRSLALDYMGSTTEIDELVEGLLRLPGVLGARITGGGFGGCVIALCEEGSPALKRSTHAPRPAWRVRPSAGAAVLVP
jgi:galactokinase